MKPLRHLTDSYWLEESVFSCIPCHPTLNECAASVQADSALPGWLVSLIYSWCLPIYILLMTATGPPLSFPSQLSLSQYILTKKPRSHQPLLFLALKKTYLQFQSQSLPVSSCLKHLTQLGLGGFSGLSMSLRSLCFFPASSPRISSRRQRKPVWFLCLPQNHGWEQWGSRVVCLARYVFT